MYLCKRGTQRFPARISSTMVSTCISKSSVDCIRLLFTIDLLSMYSGVSLAMVTNVGASAFRLVVLAVALSSSFAVILALPAFPLSPNLSPVQVNTSSLLISPNPGPPQEPTCPPTEQWGVTLGHPSYDDCDYILSNLYPKDPLSKPVLRNFYVAPADVSHTMSNFKLPYEESYRKRFSNRPSRVRGIFGCANLAAETCSIQMLLAADFINIPNDEATWNDLRGATRTILRTCIRGRGLGGVITKNGIFSIPMTHIRHHSFR